MDPVHTFVVSYLPLRGKSNKETSDAEGECTHKSCNNATRHPSVQYNYMYLSSQHRPH